VPTHLVVGIGAVPVPHSDEDAVEGNDGGVIRGTPQGWHV